MMAGYNRFICFQKMNRCDLEVLFVLDSIKRFVSVDLKVLVERIQFENSVLLEFFHLILRNTCIAFFPNI